MLCRMCVCLSRYILDLSVPHWQLRAELWQKLLPKQVPIAGDINFTQLAKK